MSKALIIAEKPSVAQDIVRALTPSSGKFDKHEDHFENERYVLDPPLHSREELAYFRMFQRELKGVDPQRLVGRFEGW